MKVGDLIEYLGNYNGPEVKLMEVCGTHTSAIFKNGIRSLISPKIKLISGPGCPVCVTPTSFIDKCIEYATKEDHILFTFGDMMKVPGTYKCLSDMKSQGAKVRLMYTPFEAVQWAKANPDKTAVVAAVGFETTAPSYGLMLQEAQKESVTNLKVVTALKTIIPALSWICENQDAPDGFICPGHVSVIIGSQAYNQLAAKYHKPFVVAGFQGEHILAVIYDIVRQIAQGKENVDNLYKNVVKTQGNLAAQQVIEQCYQAGTATWRGLGAIEGSGLYLKGPYQVYDGGSHNLDVDKELPKECKCGQVIIGRINPNQCPMFGSKCTPMNPYGPCMVSPEGACGIWHRNI